MVKGTRNSPASSSVRNRTRGRLLGANSWGPPSAYSASLVLSSISPMEGLKGCKAAISRRAMVPGLAWGSMSVSSNTNLQT